MAIGSGAPLTQRVTGSTRARMPAPASGAARRVKIIPVAMPTMKAATLILRSKAASAHQAAKKSAAQNSAIPGTVPACRRPGSRNSLRTR